MQFPAVENLPLTAAEETIIQMVIEQQSEENLTIGIFGSFSVGKSELLNQLLEADQLLPTHTTETTAIPTHIKYGTALTLQRETYDGELYDLDLEYFHKYIAGPMLDESLIESTKELHVTIPGPSWMENMTFIDTPGRNTKYERHIQASEQALLSADAAIYVMPWQGLTMEDIVYLQQILLYQPNLYFVINKIDRIDESQGISVEDVCQQVQNNLEEKLGKSYPIFAVSAKTGERLEGFVEQCVLQIAASTKELKEKRLQYVVMQWALSVQHRLTEEVHLLEVAMSSYENQVQGEYQSIELERQRVEEQVQEKVLSVQKRLVTYEENFKSMIDEEVITLESALLRLVVDASEKEVEQLNLEIQHELLLARKRIVTRVQERLKYILGEHITFQVEAIQGDSKKVQPLEYNAEGLLEIYEEEKQRHIASYLEKEQRLEELISENLIDTEEERELLRAELEEIQEALSVEYVPQMIERVQKNQGIATKVLQTAGLGVDVLISVALSPLTGGGSIATKAGGKISAKAVQEALKDMFTKKGLMAARKKIIQEGAERLTARTLQHESLSKEANAAGRFISTFDKVTSPVETLAKSIGEVIDGGDKVYEEEDYNYRREFFARKMDIEREYSKRMKKLKEIEREKQKSEKARQLATQQIKKIKREQERVLAEKEQQLQQEIKKEAAQKKKQHVEKEIHSLLQQEVEHYQLWIGLELDRASQAIAYTYPKLMDEKLTHWKEQLDELVQKAEGNQETLQQELEEKNAALFSLEKWIEEGQYVEN